MNRILGVGRDKGEGSCQLKINFEYDVLRLWEMVRKFIVRRVVTYITKYIHDLPQLLNSTFIYCRLSSTTL
jgi:hypothetical protein